MSSALQRCWSAAAQSDATSPGRSHAYYSLAIGDEVLQGERQWEPRWAAIASAVHFEGRRLLELGCNLGLLSIYAELFGDALPGLGVDHDDEIVRQAGRLAELVDSSAEFRTVSFDSAERWEDELDPNRFDLVAALSVSQWVGDKDRFFRFLGRFSEVLYEGHDPPEMEMARLRTSGFTTFTSIQVNERGRLVFVAHK